VLRGNTQAIFDGLRAVRTGETDRRHWEHDAQRRRGGFYNDYCNPMTDVKCAHCKWFLAETPDDGEGECHRFPPNPMTVPQDYVDGGGSQKLIVVNYFPQCDWDSFCGEFMERNQVEKHSLDSLSVNCLKIGARARNALLSNGIESIGKLTQIHADQLMQFRNFGVRCLAEIRLALGLHGLALPLEQVVK
jgi:hypothetical protein